LAHDAGSPDFLDPIGYIITVSGKLASYGISTRYNLWTMVSLHTDIADPLVGK
jgi:hypothetical protein